MTEYREWHQTLPFRRTGRTDYLVGIYDDATRETDGIAQVYGATRDEANARARLIRLAPQMITALRGAWDAQTDLTDTNWRDVAKWQAVERIIAKAEGGQP